MLTITPKELESKFIEDKTEILQFYTSIIRNETANPKDRIKSAGSLTKTKGMFISKL